MLLENKRPIPASDKQLQRKKIYDAAALLQPIPPSSENFVPYGLEDGNKITSTTGSIFDKVFVWNLPMRATCPGASEWCRSNCYNLDMRQEIYPIQRWQQNWWWSLNDPATLETRIFQQLSEYSKKRIGVRLHSCGDFYSTDYIAMWYKICTMFPDIQFWGYTRSWAVDSLLNSLSHLASLNNVNLFASWDSSMEQEPTGWRKSIVVSTNKDVVRSFLEGNTFICPEQYSQIGCCADCGFCARYGKANVIFVLH